MRRWSSPRRSSGSHDAAHPSPLTPARAMTHGRRRRRSAPLGAPAPRDWASTSASSRCSHTSAASAAHAGRTVSTSCTRTSSSAVGAGEALGELVQQLVARPLRAVARCAGTSDDAPHRRSEEQAGDDGGDEARPAPRRSRSLGRAGRRWRGRRRRTRRRDDRRDRRRRAPGRRSPPARLGRAASGGRRRRAPTTTAADDGADDAVVAGRRRPAGQQRGHRRDPVAATTSAAPATSRRRAPGRITRPSAASPALARASCGRGAARATAASDHAPRRRWRGGRARRPAARSGSGGRRPAPATASGRWRSRAARRWRRATRVTIAACQPTVARACRRVRPSTWSTATSRRRRRAVLAIAYPVAPMVRMTTKPASRRGSSRVGDRLRWASTRPPTSPSTPCHSSAYCSTGDAGRGVDDDRVELHRIAGGTRASSGGGTTRAPSS